MEKSSEIGGNAHLGGQFHWGGVPRTFEAKTLDKALRSGAPLVLLHTRHKRADSARVSLFTVSRRADGTGSSAVLAALSTAAVRP